LPEIVQEIGAYAGLASVLGLAVLSVLYFSQARDVKRLREWAGRAPERSGQGTPAVPGRVVAQPQQPAAQRSAPAGPAPPPVPGRPATPAAGRPVPATPAGQVAPAAAAATGAGPATAQQAKPAGQNANAGAAAAAASGAAAGAAAKPGDAPNGEQSGQQPDAASRESGESGPAGAGQSGPASADRSGPAGADQPGAKPPAPASSDAAPAATAPAAVAPETAPRERDAAAARAGTPAPGPLAGTPAPSPPARPPAGTSAPAPPARPPAPPPSRQAGAATPAAGRGSGAPHVPAGERRFVSPPGVTSRHSPQETAILPPRPNERWYSRLGARYLAVALVGLMVLGAAAAYGVSQLSGDDDGGGGARQATPVDEDRGNGSGQRQRGQGGAVKPANVTVAVLNGTTVPGLAATLSDEVLAAGFKVGTITNFSDQQLAESVVQYGPGHEPEARAVSRRLGITQREPVNPSSQALAGDATVIVIAGADKAP
jgi:hypothetical protein